MARKHCTKHNRSTGGYDRRLRLRGFDPSNPDNRPHMSVYPKAMVRKGQAI